MPNFQPTAYAIDFGTTNSLLSAANAEGITPPVPVDPTASDPTILRTLLFFPDSTQCYFGAEAVSRYVGNDMQGRLIRSIKKHLPSRSFIGTHIDDRPMNLEDLIGSFLGEMRRRANAYFDADVTTVVLGRPARFSESDVDDKYAEYRLERAAKNAGFTQVSFCPEPVAAALSGDDVFGQATTIVSADFGGGTSDFTVFRLGADRLSVDDVLAIGGIAVAGDALDGALMRTKIAKHFGAEVRYRAPFGSNVMEMPKALLSALCSPADLSVLRGREMRSFYERVQAGVVDQADKVLIDQLYTLVDDSLGFDIFEAIEKGKRALSSADDTEICYSYPTIEVQEAVSRTEFESAAAPSVARIARVLDDTLARAGVAPEQVDLVVCTGGTARVPNVHRLLTTRFSPDKITSLSTFHSVNKGLSKVAMARA